MDPESSLVEIVVGTYEKFLIGYKLEMNSDQFVLKPSFTAEAHLQSVRCLASSEKFLASGSTDETIQLFNMKTRQELGALIHHNGTVTSLQFFKSCLISSSEDGTICIWSTSSWQCLKILKGHKNAVNCIAIHPTGKMALSISKDKTLRTWNLIKGCSVFVTNIKKVADLIRWSPDGSYFVVSCANIIDVYAVETASITLSIDFKQKISDFAFVKDDLLAVGGESEFVRFYDPKSGELSSEFKAHDSRVKAISCVSAGGETFLVTTSSDGYIKVWYLDLTEADLKPKRIAKANVGNRPTCMTVMLSS